MYVCVCVFVCVLLITQTPTIVHTHLRIDFEQLGHIKSKLLKVNHNIYEKILIINSQSTNIQYKQMCPLITHLEQLTNN